MKTVPVPVRLDKYLQDTLRDGARRTPHKKQDLIRLTLRRHLRAVIEQEAVSPDPLKDLKPLTKAESRRCYQQPNREFDALEHHLAGLPSPPPEVE